MKLTNYFLTTVWLCLLACSDSPTGPEKPNLPDPRQFTWTIDTLAYPSSIQTSMDNIWASAPDNVYLVGHNDDADARMYHYDGQNWRPISFNGIGPYSLRDIYGFSGGDIWVVGNERHRISPPINPVYADSSLFLHFDGSSWRRPQFKRHHILETIWGSAPDDIWAGGVNGALFHYDGESWQPSTLPFDIPFDTEPFWNITKITGGPGKPTYLLLIGYPPPSGQTTSMLLEWQNENWTTVHSRPGYFYTALWMTPSGKLLGGGIPNSAGMMTISSWENGAWHELQAFDDFLPRTILGTSDDNIFAVGRDADLSHGKIFHYDGTEWRELNDLALRKVIFTDVWTNSDEAFIIGQLFDIVDGLEKTVVLHGK